MTDQEESWRRFFTTSPLPTHKQMDSTSAKIRLILEYEQHFANSLAGKVLDKPKLDIWMFLLPVLFVYYMNDLKKFKEGRTTFAAHYLITPKRALEEAAAVVQSGKTADPDSLAIQPEMSGEVRQKLAELFAVLIEHYKVLLLATGDDYNALVRSAYGNRTNYQLYLNQLNWAEKKLNIALKPQLVAASAGAGDILRAMEKHAEQIRRDQAAAVFS